MTPELSARTILQRLERVPITFWHVRARIIIGTATFFDAFDVLAISVVLPVLVTAWHLSPAEIGFVISSGFAGQLVGAFLFGWMGERYGRLHAMVWSVAVLAFMSLACAFAWNYTSLVVFRTIQGIGIGGEVPVAAAYINEISKARRRGRFFLLYEMLFGVGLTSAGLVGYWLVPRAGWQSMFLIGAIPALLALVLRRLLPESPRWLVSKGRLQEADQVVGAMEAYAAARGVPPLPATGAPEYPPAETRPTRWQELFSSQYRRRTFTVWTMWFCCYFVTYGLITWLPTIYRTVYKLDVATALRFGLTTNLAGLVGDLLVAFVIDITGRRIWLGLAFTLGALPLGAIWFLGTTDVRLVVLCASLSYVFAGANSLVCYLYTPEVYPTRLRALGSGIATAWLRAASVIAPSVVGYLLTHSNLSAVFLMFALVSLFGAVTVGTFAVETRERVLEEVSP